MKGTYQNTERPWTELCIDAVIGLTESLGDNRRSSNSNKLRNYNILNNKIDEQDFLHVTKPFNVKDENGVVQNLISPAKLQPYDVLSRIFKLLLGEEVSRYFSPIVRTIDTDSISMKSKAEKEAVIQAFTELLKAEIEGNPNQQPEKLIKLAQSSIKDIREKQAYDLLTYYMHRLNLTEKFQKGMKDWLVAGEEIYRIEKLHNQPKVTKVNPLELFFTLPRNTDYLDKADKICEKTRMTVSEIIDEFYDKLTPTQIDLLEKGVTGDFNYTELAPDIRVVDSIDSVLNYNTSEGLYVYRCRWASFKNIKFVHYYDEQGIEQEMLVDESFVNPDPTNPNMWVESFWIKQYWQGTRIGTDLYLDCGPLDIRFGTDANDLSECSSGYIGTIGDADNSQSTSLMDRLVPWLYLFIVTAYRLELLMATNWSKIALIDTSLIPDGWDPERWMWYAINLKFGFVNSYNEGLKGERKGQMNQSTQNRSLDLEQGNSIQHYIEILDWLKQKIADTSGVSEQRMGAIASNELVGNTERAVVQSSHITEEYFAIHNNTKIRVLEAVLEVAKECIKGGNKTIESFTDETSSILSHIDGDNFSAADYGIYISNSPKDQQALQMFKNHLQAALQNDKIEFSQIADILTSDSISAIKTGLKVGEQQRHEREQQAQEAQMQHEKELLQREIDNREDIQLFQSEENQLDRENAIYLAELKALGNDAMSTPVDDSAMIINNSKVALEQLKLSSDNIKHLREQSHKDKELQVKKEIEEKKLKQIESQNRNQIELANKKAKLDEKMMEQKIKLEAMKAKAAIRKSKSSK